MPPPSDVTVEKPICIGPAKSSIAVQTAPDCATSASLPGSAIGAQNVALSPMSVRTTPNAPGPSSRMPRFFAIVVTSRRHARDTALSAISGYDSNAALLICARSSSRIPGTVEGGVAMTARSIGLPIAASVACAGRPKSRRWFGLTAKISPWNCPASRFSKTVRPSEPVRSDAPTSATDFGVSSGAR